MTQAQPHVILRNTSKPGLPRFIQIHFLSSYAAALLNRDDQGFAKRIPFGGSSRLRVSSQCLKHHWRRADGEDSFASLGQNDTIRSRFIFETEIIQPLTAEGKYPEKLVRETVKAFVPYVLGESAKAVKDKAAEEKKNEEKKAKKAADKAEKASKKGGKKGDDEGPASEETVSPEEFAPYQTAQVVVLGRPEVLYLLGIARELCEKTAAVEPDKLTAAVEAFFKAKGNAMRENLRSIPQSCGLDAALFGRMSTSDFLAHGDAALHVAQAITTHGEETESDYFLAIDDLSKSLGKMGGGHINSVELASGLYYGYVVVDLALLVSNTMGCDRKKWQTADRTLAAGVVERLIHMVATVSPGAKLGSTAPYTYANLVMVEAGTAQPCTLANAFLKPVSTGKANPDLAANTFNAMAAYLTELDRSYGKRNQRCLMAMSPTEALVNAVGQQPKSLDEVATWAKTLVLG